jgi:hypothetical protein
MVEAIRFDEATKTKKPTPFATLEKRATLCR